VNALGAGIVLAQLVMTFGIIALLDRTGRKRDDDPSEAVPGESSTEEDGREAGHGRHGVDRQDRRARRHAEAREAMGHVVAIPFEIGRRFLSRVITTLAVS